MGVRSYNKISNDAILNSDDPYKQSMTRFDIHVGPVFAMGVLVLSPQFGLWYAGMSDNGPKVKLHDNA